MVDDNSEEYDAFDEETPILSRGNRNNRRHPKETSIVLVENDATGKITGKHDDFPSASATTAGTFSIVDVLCTFLSSIPATILITMLNTCLSVPFGSAYFSSVIPLDGETREQLGIRLSLMALFVGQFVMGGGLGPFGSSSFDPVIVWQLGELSPFYHTMAEIAAALAHSDDEILPTTLYLMGVSSACVGLLFYFLGKGGYGQLTYFFPTHVLLGLVGGIGLWLAVLSTSISISPSRAPPGAEIQSAWTVQFLVAVMFAVTLSVFRRIFPKEKFMLLDPIFFLSIPFVFYLGLALFGVTVEDAIKAGYFFADPDKVDDPPEDVLPPWIEASQLWTDFDFTKVRWNAVFYAAPTLLSAAVMGVLIASPFIPATATLFPSTEFDYNREFISNGWCNFLSALACPGGLGLSVCYSTTSVYKAAGGRGKLANALAAFLMLAAVVYGPGLVQHVPRCMASAIVLDLGIALFLEAVVEPFKNCDRLEYISIWVIIVVLNAVNMTAALVASLLAAVFTYSLQTFVDKDPVRFVCDASDFPSSKWRDLSSKEILNDDVKGRSRIVIVQLQSYIFFGNAGKIQEQIFSFLNEKSQGNGAKRLILDFSIVSGIDTTAAMYFETMIQKIKKKFDCSTYMVSGPLELQDGSLEETKRVSGKSRRASSVVFSQTSPSQAFSGSESSRSGRRSQKSHRISVSVRGHYETLSEPAEIHGTFFETLDEAIIKSEDDLIADHDWKSLVGLPAFNIREGDEERDELVEILKQKFPDAAENDVADLVSSCNREVRRRGESLWMEGDEGISVMVLLGGTLTALMDDGDGSGKKRQRSIEIGDIVGLRCMLLGEVHRAHLYCETDCIFYVVSKEMYLRLIKENPQVAQLLLRYLAHDLSRRLQHASNRLYLNRGASSTNMLGF